MNAIYLASETNVKFYIVFKTNRTPLNEPLSPNRKNDWLKISRECGKILNVFVERPALALHLSGTHFVSSSDDCPNKLSICVCAAQIV